MVESFVNRIFKIINADRLHWKGLAENVCVKCSFFSAVVFGFATYVYLACNNLHNYDDLLCTPAGVGQGITAGRWLIQLIWERQIKWGGGNSFYNAPAFNTLIAVMMLVGVCVLLALIYDLRSKTACITLSAITMTAPAISAAMVFNFTAHIYAYSLFLITFGVFVGKRKHIVAFILGALLIGRGTGGYQAYIAYAAVLLVILLVKELYDEEIDAAKSIKNGIRYFVLLLSGYAIYMIALKYYLHKFNMQLSSYQGIDKMGEIEIARLPEMIKIVYTNMLLVTRDTYLSFSIDSVVRTGIIIAYVITLISFVLYVIRYRNIAKSAIYFLYLLILPVALDAIEIMAPEATKYSLQSLSMIGIFYCPVIFSDSYVPASFPISKADEMDIIPILIGKAISVISAVCIMNVAVNFCYVANVNYTSIKYHLQVAENYYLTLYNQILGTDGYSGDKEIVLVGGARFQNYPSVDKWAIEELKLEATGVDVNVYSKVRFFELYIGETFRDITEDELVEYNDLINTMQVYPNKGSIISVDDKMLIKIAE